MRDIDIIVSTRNRWSKLERMTRTIPGKILEGKVGIHLKIFCDGDQATYEALATAGLAVEYSPEQRGAVYGRNVLAAKAEDAILYATDDIEFQPGSIEAAARSLLERFPDEDAVIGFHQEGNSYNPAGVALVGGPFLARYPGKQIFFPGYFHFAAQEVHDAATYLRRFHLCRKAVIFHHHPMHDQREMDQTHRDARKYHAQDRAIRAARQKAGRIHGIN